MIGRLGIARRLTLPVERHAFVPFAVVQHAEPARHAVAVGLIRTRAHPLHAVRVDETGSVVFERTFQDHRIADAPADVGEAGVHRRRVCFVLDRGSRLEARHFRQRLGRERARMQRFEAPRRHGEENQCEVRRIRDLAREVHDVGGRLRPEPIGIVHERGFVAERLGGLGRANHIVLRIEAQVRDELEILRSGALRDFHELDVFIARQAAL